MSDDIPNNAANTSGTAANLSGTPALPNGTTATTQAYGNSSTDLATTAFLNTPESLTGGSGPYFYGGCPVGSVPIQSSNANVSQAAITPTANQVWGFLFYLAAPIAVNKITVHVTTAGAASEVVGMGIYTLTGNRSVYATFVTSSTGYIAGSVTGATTLVPGWYYFAYTSSNTTCQCDYWATGSATEPFILTNNQAARYGALASNSSASGVLPSALGTLTYNTGADNRSMFLCLFET